MKYQHKITKIVVQAEKFTEEKQIQLIHETQLVFGQVKKDQYLLSFFNEKGEVVNQQIINKEQFLEQYEPKVELLLG